MKLNPYILLVMKWLDDEKSVSIGELRKNAVAAYVDVVDYVVADTLNLNESYTVDARSIPRVFIAQTSIVAITAVNTASYTTFDLHAGAVKVTIDGYFETTGENKQDYIDQIEKDKK